MKRIAAIIAVGGLILAACASTSTEETAKESVVAAESEAGWVGALEAAGCKVVVNPQPPGDVTQCPNGAQLGDADLTSAHLEGAHLEFANLQLAYLINANLDLAHLEYAGLQGAHLEGAHLEFANLQFANLEFANLEGANLEGANLEKALLGGAVCDKDTTWPNGKKGHGTECPKAT